jgi:lipopolysaccharide assembly outer membrane protein LptD (OstA)
VHIHALELYGGAPTLTLPDNTKTAVSRACRYDPDLNPTDQEFAVHYAVAHQSAAPTLTFLHRREDQETRRYETQVFVAYNLFSLQADKVTYDPQKRTIEASGNVVAVNESGTTQRAGSMAFKIENGQVALLR